MGRGQGTNSWLVILKNGKQPMENGWFAQYLLSSWVLTNSLLCCGGVINDTFPCSQKCLQWVEWSWKHLKRCLHRMWLVYTQSYLCSTCTKQRMGAPSESRVRGDWDEMREGGQQMEFFTFLLSGPGLQFVLVNRYSQDTELPKQWQLLNYYNRVPENLQNNCQ